MICRQCDWRSDPEATTKPAVQLEEHAEDVGHRLCPCCHLSLTGDEASHHACERCLTLSRELLSGIATMWTELPAHLGHIRGATYDTDRPTTADGRPLPGGDVLVLASPGSTGAAARRLTTAEQRAGMDGREHGWDNRDTDAPSVAQLLCSWQDDWLHTAGHPAADLQGGTGAAMRAAVGYLEVHARWAAEHHDAFEDYLTDLRALHSRLERATGRQRQPTKANAACFDCGGRLMRQVNPTTGLEDDHVTCDICRAQYDPSRYALALAAQVEQASRMVWDGDAYATPAVTAGLLRRSERTVRDWARRGLIGATSRAGVLFVSIGDAQRESATRDRRSA